MLKINRILEQERREKANLEELKRLFDENPGLKSGVTSHKSPSRTLRSAKRFLDPKVQERARTYID